MVTRVARYYILQGSTSFIVPYVSRCYRLYGTLYNMVLTSSMWVIFVRKKLWHFGKTQSNETWQSENPLCLLYNNEIECPYEEKCVLLHEESSLCKFGSGCERSRYMYKHKNNTAVSAFEVDNGLYDDEKTSLAGRVTLGMKLGCAWSWVCLGWSWVWDEVGSGLLLVHLWS